MHIAFLILALGSGFGGDAELLDSGGTAHRLAEWDDAPILVLGFLRADCPVARFYATRLQDIAHELGPRGVTVLGIDPNPSDGRDAIVRIGRELSLDYPLLRDGEQALARRFGVTRTPEVVVLDRQHKVRYQGRIDDQVIPGQRRAAPTRHDLREALADLLAGRPVQVARTPAAGCPLESASPRLRSENEASAATYHRDVAPILQRRCVTCHRPGGIGPFTLDSAAAASRRAKAIAEAVAERRMPPWHADPRFGRFANDPSLTDAERRTIETWANAGAPLGEDPRSAGGPQDSNPRTWQMPEPDTIVALPEPFHVPADGVVDYQITEVDPGFREDVWVQAAEIRPGCRGVVHHATVYLRPPGAKEVAAVQGELQSFCLCAYAMGTPPMQLPTGHAKKIPAGWRLVFLIHYVPNGTAQIDQTAIGLRRLDTRQVKREVATNLLIANDFTIPPHAADHVITRNRTFTDNVHLLALFPHMHLRGRSFRYEATYPDGHIETLLSVPKWDMDWQHRYELAEPKFLPAGTILTATAHYDNSSANPTNPDPNAAVRAGPRTEDEMFNGYYDFCLAETSERPALARLLSQPATWSCLALVLCAAFWMRRRPSAVGQSRLEASGKR
jgi:peroxiredoxin/mono/diheme cytochrome c family protein